jgi:hypothetical protein
MVERKSEALQAHLRTFEAVNTFSRPHASINNFAPNAMCRRCEAITRTSIQIYVEVPRKATVTLSPTAITSTTMSKKRGGAAHSVRTSTAILDCLIESERPTPVGEDTMMMEVEMDAAAIRKRAARMSPDEPSAKRSKLAKPNSQPLLSVGRPELFAMLARGRNNDVDVTTLRLGSGRKVWWTCPTDNHHAIQRSIISMVEGKRSCPSCEFEKHSLKKQCPGLFRELHPTKNVGIDTDKLTKGLHQIVWWVCPAAGHEYEAKIINRALNNSTCRDCFRASRNTYSQEQKSDRGEVVNAIGIGDQTEEYVLQLLKKHPEIESVEKIGEWSGYVDLVVKLRTDERRRSLQVKTFVQNSFSFNEQLTVKLKATYPVDLLVAMVTKDRTKFACSFAGMLPMKFTLPWNSESSGYANLRSFTEGDFGTSIIKNLSCSHVFSSIEETLSPNVRAEYEMFVRLRAACETRGISCIKNKTNGDCVDVFINGRPTQLKYVTHRVVGGKSSHFIAKAKLSKSSGFKDGKRIMRPLSASDPFDFVVVEVSSGQEPRHFGKGEFYIFTKEYLVEKGVVSSASSAGKQTMAIACDAYTKSHYAKGFCNRFELLS